MEYLCTVNQINSDMMIVMNCIVVLYRVLRCIVKEDNEIIVYQTVRYEYSICFLLNKYYDENQIIALHR